MQKKKMKEFIDKKSKKKNKKKKNSHLLKINKEINKKTKNKSLFYYSFSTPSPPQNKSFCFWKSSLKQNIPIFTNPSARAGYDTMSIFKRSLTGLNSEFSFF